MSEFAKELGRAIAAEEGKEIRALLVDLRFMLLRVRSLRNFFVNYSTHDLNMSVFDETIKRVDAAIAKIPELSAVGERAPDADEIDALLSSGETPIIPPPTVSYKGTLHRDGFSYPYEFPFIPQIGMKIHGDEVCSVEIETKDGQLTKLVVKAASQDYYKRAYRGESK